MTFLQKSFSTNQLEKIFISCVASWGPSGSHVCKSIYEKLATPPIFASSLFFFASWPVAIITASKMGNLYFGQHHPFFKNTVLHVWLILLVKHKLFSFVKMSTFNFILMWGRPHQNATPNFRPNFFGLRSNNKFARAGDV